MTKVGKDTIYNRWYESKSGVIDLHDLNIVKYKNDDPDFMGHWCDCPCGSDEHWAWLPWYTRDGDIYPKHGDVLTCFVTDKQWLIRQPDVAGRIFAEEKKYIELLTTASALVEKVVKKRGWSEETKLFLKETHGIPMDISQDIAEMRAPEWLQTLRAGK
jgi:hypothetical protein